MNPRKNAAVQFRRARDKASLWTHTQAEPGTASRDGAYDRIRKAIEGEPRSRFDAPREHAKTVAASLFDVGRPLRPGDIRTRMAGALDVQEIKDGLGFLMEHGYVYRPREGWYTWVGTPG